MSVTFLQASNAVSEECVSHTLMMLQHLLTGSPWAVKMFDSWSKVPESVMMGNLMDLGNYDECLEVDVNEKWGSFVGQLCTVMLFIPLGLFSKFIPVNISAVPVGVSTCLPSTCSPGEIKHFLSSVIPLRVEVAAELCHSQNTDRPFQAADWIAVALLTVLGVLCIVGTAHSLLVTSSEQRNRFLLLFSWYTNLQNLFMIRARSDFTDMLHGVRFFSMVWIILGHSYVYCLIHTNVNLMHGPDMVRDWPHVAGSNGVLAVDTFLLLSGLLVCYVVMTGLDKGYPFILPVFYLHRIFRIIPVLAIVMLLEMTLLPRISSGPLWELGLASRRHNCEKYWWSTLLFVQNYVNVQDVCVPVSWFLAVDMQLYWASPIFLLALRKKPKIGIGLIIAACVAGIVVMLEQAYVHGDEPSMITEGGLDDRYYQTHMRFVPWIVGLGCGYLIYRTAADARRLPLVVLYCGWILSAIICVGVVLGLYPFQQKSYVRDRLAASCYIAFSRTFWSLGVGWIIFACVSGYGGVVNTVLTWKVLQPLSRLTFCMYLLHVDVIICLLASPPLPGYLEDADIWFRFLQFLAVTIIASIVMTLTVESPLIRLEGVLLKQYSRSSRKEDCQVENTSDSAV